MRQNKHTEKCKIMPGMCIQLLIMQKMDLFFEADLKGQKTIPVKLKEKSVKFT